MKKRRVAAQATLFIILGIVLVAVFSFALYARSLIVTDEMRTQAELLLGDTIQSNSINYYVENCLEQVSTEALYTIAAQGGTLSFEDQQPGIGYFPLNDSGTTYNISYATKPNERCDEVADKPPQYPRDKTPLQELPGIYERSACKNDLTSGFFGQYVLPRLCYLHGANAFQKTPGYLDLACKPSAYGVGDDTMQQQLEAFVEQELPTCVRFEQFADAMGYNISVQQEKLEAQVVYGQEGVVVTATYPFKVRVAGRSVTASQDFTHRSPIRIRKAYELVMELVRQDNLHHDFSIEDDYDAVRAYDPTFNVSVLPDRCTDHKDCPYNPMSQSYAVYDDVLRVVDERVRVDNRTFMFQAAIRNRAPALDYLHEAWAGGDYDIKRGQEETITLTPRGYDPDDGEVSYTYEGWREDYATVLDTVCCEQGPGGPDGWPGECTLENHQECTLRIKDDDGDEVVPHNWTNSEAYQSTGRDAKIQLSVNDTGIHEVIITATDDSGLYDFQRIRILVFDLPVAVANGSNGFEGIDDGYASIEDPYLLNGTESRKSTMLDSEISRYSWKGYDIDGDDLTEAFHIETEQGLFTIPTGLPGWTQEAFYDEVKDITAYPLNTSDGLPTSYRLELVVTSEGNDVSLPSWMDLQLYECLPARGASEPYPYNTTSVYEYNHTCCLGETDQDGKPVSISQWGVAAPKNTICHEETLWGSFKELDAHLEQMYGTPAAEPEKVTKKLRFSSKETATEENYESMAQYSDTHNYQNDIFRMDFERHCDGRRGNTCTGNVTVTFTKTKECADFSSSETARCQGPRSASESAQQQCKLYQWVDQGQARTTFEDDHSLDKRYNGEPANVCNPVWKCSARDGYDEGGDFLCQSGCNGNDGTCSFAVNCRCDSNTCGATCDAATDYDLENGKCKYACDTTNSCDYVGDEQCSPSLICDDTPSDLGWQYGLDFNECSNNRNLDEAQVCYYRNACTASGCEYADNQVIPAGICARCTTGGVQEGDYCPPPGTYEDGKLYTYQEPWARGCDASLSCTGGRTITKIEDFLASCPSGSGARPTVSGFTCCTPGENGCIMP